MSNIECFSKAIKEIYKARGNDAFENSRLFNALLDDLIPQCVTERKILRSVMTDSLLKELFNLKDINIDFQFEIAKIKRNIEENSGLSEKWSLFIIEVFCQAFMSQSEFKKLDFTVYHEDNDEQRTDDLPNDYSFVLTEFDPIAYEKFSQESDYIAAQNLERNENYGDAFVLYETAYNNGNLLAGVKLALLYSDGCGIDKSKEKAYRIFSVAQKKGDPLAKAWISEYYRMGYAVPQDKAKSKKILESCVNDLEQMCACGDAEAQYFLGYEYLYGLALEKNETKGFNLLKKAYASNKISAGVALADCYINGLGCPVDAKLGIELLEKCAKTTNKKAHFELAKLYYYGTHVEKDYKRAFSLFIFAAECGHKASQDYVGDCYYYGDGVQKDYVKAVEWYTKAYEQGNIHAAGQLGKMYYSGQGVELDKEKSFYYFNYAAERGNRYSQFFLHYFYLADGKYQDYEKGLMYLIKAAEADYAEAQVILGKLYCHGDYGLEESEEKSYQWFHRAAELENAEAERIVGEMYTHDFYVEQDPYKSLEWLKKAASHGDIEAHILIAELYMDGSLDTKDYSNGDKYLSLCKEILNKDSFYIKSGLWYKDIADAYYKYGKEFCKKNNGNNSFIEKATSLYHLLYSNGHDNVLYDYAWSIFVDEVQVEHSVDASALIEGLKEQAISKKSACCASLLSRIYKSGYPSDLFLFFEEKKYRGPIIKADKQESEKWTKIAISNGDSSLACKFAIELSKDLKRHSEAFEYSKLAHEMGDYQGTFLLGNCYKKGIGVKKDRAKAKELLKIAKANGYS